MPPPHSTMQIAAVLLPVLLLIFSYGNAAAQSPVSGFNPAVLSDKPAGVFIEGSAFSGSGAVGLKAIFLDEWDGSFHPDDENHADLYWRTAAGVAYGGWRTAVFYRGEAFLKSNRDTLEFLRMANLKKLDPAGALDIDVSIKGFSATGIELSKGFSLDGLLEGLDAGVTARYLRGHQIQEGSLTGTAVTTSSVTYDFDIFLDYVYDTNLVYDRPDAIAGNGDGMSFDVGFRYVYSPALKAELLFRDVLGRIYWKNVPYTTANAASDVITFDESGFQQYNPTISGFESYKDYTQKLQLKTDLSVSYTRGPFLLRPEVNFLGDGHALKWVFAGYEAWSTLFTAGYNFDYTAVSLGVMHRNFRLQAFTDDLDIEDANALGVSFAAGYEF